MNYLLSQHDIEITLSRYDRDTLIEIVLAAEYKTQVHLAGGGVSGQPLAGAYRTEALAKLEGLRRLTSALGREPIHAHDCESCRFLGTSYVESYKGCDLYYCSKEGTAIARFGPEDDAYASGPSGTKQPMLAEAWARAERRGLLTQPAKGEPYGV